MVSMEYNQRMQDLYFLYLYCKILIIYYLI